MRQFGGSRPLSRPVATRSATKPHNTRRQEAGAIRLRARSNAHKNTQSWSSRYHRAQRLAISATARWATRSTSRCSINAGQSSLSAAKPSRAGEIAERVGSLCLRPRYRDRCQCLWCPTGPQTEIVLYQCVIRQTYYIKILVSETVYAAQCHIRRLVND